MATCNGEKFLREQLDSIVGQTRSPDEIIIVDDVSTDNTWAILESYASQYSNVRIIRNIDRLGINENFRKVLLLCTGDRVFISDQDDIWEKWKIACFLEAEKGDSLVYCDAKIIDESGAVAIKSEFEYLSVFPVSGNKAECFIFDNCVSGHNAMVTRELILRACFERIPSYVFYDQWLAFVASIHGGVRYISGTHCRHRIHRSNANNNRTRIGFFRRDKKYFDAEVDGIREFIAASRHIVPQGHSLHGLIDVLARHADMLRDRVFNPSLFFRLLSVRGKIFSGKFTFRHGRRLFRFCCGGALWRLRYVGLAEVEGSAVTSVFR